MCVYVEVAKFMFQLTVRSLLPKRDSIVSIAGWKSKQVPRTSKQADFGMFLGKLEYRSSSLVRVGGGVLMI